MTNLGIGNGLSALLAAQASLDTVGNNLANVNTPGYSRQRVDLGSGLSVARLGLRFGTGVDTLGISRSVDNLVQSRLLTALGGQGRIGAAASSLQGIGSIFGELGGNGIGDGLERFYSAASALAAGPADPILRNDLVQGAQSVVNRFREVSSGLAGAAGALEGEIEGVVAEVNGITRQIADVNSRIAALNGSPGPANELLDERDRLVSELAGLVDVQETVDQNGLHNVFAGSNLIVSGDRALSVETVELENGLLGIRTEAASNPIQLRGGSLAGLIGLQGNQLGTIETELDQLAKGLVLSTNRAHSTGVPASGSYNSLRGTNALLDVDGSGSRFDDLIGQAGLPFDVLEGELAVNIVDDATGDVDTTRIAIDPETTTVGELVDDLNGVDGLRAFVDSNGFLVLESVTGKGFDFSNRLDPTPDEAGTFGGTAATLGSSQSGPYALNAGDTLTFSVPAGGPSSVSIAFPADAFDDLSQVSSEELAEFLNSQPGFSGGGLEANAVGGYLHVGTIDGGPDQSFEVSGGSAAASLGFGDAVGQPVLGQDLAVSVELSGEYSGEASEDFVFQVVGEGTVGTTEGLAVQVLDSSGGLVATLDVGPDYTPGETLQVVDGLEVSFGLGELSESTGDRFTVDAVADSDSTDVLVALGVGGFFVGSSASTIGVREDLLDDPDLVAASSSGAAGGNRAILELLDSEEASLDVLGGRNVSQAYRDLIGGVGFEVASLEGALASSNAQVQALEERRESISGVNTDEELVDLVRFEQAYAAAAQFLSVVSQLENELLQIL